jgi:anti-sigma factor RsiW
MSGPLSAFSEHPDEQLASYVEGLADPSERGLVEAHLAACETCREELAFAQNARAVLSALPDLDSPGFDTRLVPDLQKALGRSTAAADGIEAGEPAGAAKPVFIPPARWKAGPDPTGRRSRRQRRASSLLRPWQRVAWGAAAAAVVVAAALSIGMLISSHPRQSTLGAAGPAAPERTVSDASLPPVQNVDTDYSSDTLSAKARELARSPAVKSAEAATGGSATGGTNASTPAAEAPNPSTFSGAGVADERRQAANCLAMGAGLESTAQPIDLERASFEGKPAYVGAFVTPVEGATGARLIVVAVTVDSCQPLFLVNQPL